jgi:hypothetical protein
MDGTSTAEQATRHAAKYAAWDHQNPSSTKHCTHYQALMHGVEAAPCICMPAVQEVCRSPSTALFLAVQKTWQFATSMHECLQSFSLHIYATTTCLDLLGSVTHVSPVITCAVAAAGSTAEPLSLQCSLMTKAGLQHFWFLSVVYIAVNSQNHQSLAGLPALGRGGSNKLSQWHKSFVSHWECDIPHLLLQGHTRQPEAHSTFTCRPVRSHPQLETSIQGGTQGNHRHY